MPARSKFTEARRRVVVAAIGTGASRRTAATLVGIDHATLGRWIARGRRAAPGGRWRAFFEAVEQAEAQPRLGLLPIVDEPRTDDVSRAWRFLERGELSPESPEPAEPLRITISLHDGTPIL